MKYTKKKPNVPTYIVIYLRVRRDKTDNLTCRSLNQDLLIKLVQLPNLFLFILFSYYFTGKIINDNAGLCDTYIKTIIYYQII